MSFRRVFLAILVIGCGDNDQNLTPDGPPTDTPPDPDAPPDVNPLATIQGTGLCDDVGCLTINAGVIEYEPRFALYDDGATKRRWMQLPSGTQIDTTNPDRWVFPVGTKFWKEFSRDTTRVETRFITKVLEDDLAVNSWFYVSYVWNAGQDSTTAVTAGQTNANGTEHDVPSRGQCKDCHESLTPGRVLGFQAIQLDYDSTFLDLEDLIAQDLLTNEPTGGTPGARFPIVGASATDVAALGYLHGNCGHCHNKTASTHDTVDLELLLETTELASVSATGAFKTAVFDPTLDGPFINNVCGDGIDDDLDGEVDNGCPDQTLTIDGITFPRIIVKGDPASSGLLERMTTTSAQGVSKRMPKLMVETPDPIGNAAITEWIESL